jgi:hypothetical protein
MNDKSTIETISKEADQWQRVAAYLASCHAATLESMPKSAGKHARIRQSTICCNAAAYLRGDDIPRDFGQSTKEILLAEISRCENAAIKYGGKPK